MCVLLVAACSAESLPVTSRDATSATVQASPQPSAEASTEASADPSPTSATEVTESPTVAPDTRVEASPTAVAPASTGSALVVDLGAEAIDLDRRLLGTNLPAWLGPERFGDPGFQAAVVESGTTLVRLPGGSWSNAYHWLGCEVSNPDACFWTWAARPTDFIDFLQATSLDAMWTVSINGTAQESAAAVAFFNGQVGDQTVIGVDREGINWGTVGRWAQLRADSGNPNPIGISLWEVGNEVYGGKPDSGGPQCADFGWEDVWTCDGTEYVTGINGRGPNGYDGALAHREAMLAVDPSISVGFVGVPRPNAWGDWGTEVVDAAGDDMDFYVVHEYPFDRSPVPEDAVRIPEESWPALIAATRPSLPPDLPLAITEFNLVAIENLDNNQSMTRTQNALFLALSIGELAAGGVEIANWWNLANGVAENGTDYGLFSVAEGANYRRSPAFYAFEMWSRTGTELLEVERRSNGLRMYPTRHSDGTATIVLVNRTDEAIQTDFILEGIDAPADWRVTIETLSTDDLDATDFDQRPAADVGAASEAIALDLPSWSISLIEVQPAS